MPEGCADMTKKINEPKAPDQELESKETQKKLQDALHGFAGKPDEKMQAAHDNIVHQAKGITNYNDQTKKVIIGERLRSGGLTEQPGLVEQNGRLDAPLKTA